MQEARARHPEKRVQVWFQDEARFGQKGTNSRVWSERGSRPRAVRQTEYEWTYMFGAVCPATGETNGWVMPAANTETMNLQLADFSRQIGPDVHAILVMDRAGWHTTKRLDVPENVTPVHLPPYSPELNPVELMWRYLRQRFLSNRASPDRESLEKAVASAWLRLTDDLERVKSICGFSWICEGTN